MRKIKNQTTMNGCAIQVEVNMHDYYITIFKNWMHSLQLRTATNSDIYCNIFSIKQLNMFNSWQALSIHSSLGQQWLRRTEKKTAHNTDR